jgi:hypothetical protein
LTIEISSRRDGTAHIETIEMTQPRQRFVIAAAKSPKDLSPDPNAWMLMEAKFVRR